VCPSIDAAMELATPLIEVATSSPTAAEWQIAIERVLAGGGLRLALQPIVDLRQGTVVGYEALSRFDGPPSAAPDVWFANAAASGFGPALEAEAMRRALALRRQLPPNCFLSVNVTPDYLLEPELRAVLATAAPLGGVVLELTEHRALADESSLLHVLTELRDAGAHVAIDDAGSGYAGLRWLMALSPDIVKLDRSLVHDIDRDETRTALVEMLGAFTGRIDAWLLAEGIERHGELDALIRLGVPLGQGYLLARPDLDWPLLPESLAQRVRARAHVVDRSDTVAPLVETVPVVDAGGELVDGAVAELGADLLVAVDEWNRPTGIHRPPAPPRTHLLRVRAGERVVDVVQRALTRPEPDRWDPLVCVDDLGRHSGIVRLERLIGALAETTRKEHP
jgi:EAL domain-containing protein (putative c-di-GMP-specific phosphodiesterase class I)